MSFFKSLFSSNKPKSTAEEQPSGAAKSGSTQAPSYAQSGAKSRILSELVGITG